MDSQLKKRKTLLYTSLQIIGLFLLCLIGGCFDFLNLEFTFSKVATPEYWQGVVQQMLMYSIAIGLGYLGRLEREELNNEEYGHSLTLYRDLLKSMKESFVPFIEETFNPKIKAEYIKKRNNKRLHRLDKHSKDEWKLIYRDALKSGDVDTFSYPSKRSKKYCLKRFRLEQLNTETYIKENLNYISIKYPRINPNCFTENIRVGDNNSSRYKVENATAKDVGFGMAKKALSTLLAGAIIGLIVYDPSVTELLEQANGWIAVMIKYIIRVTMVFVSFGRGTYMGKDIFYDNFILVCNNRVKILKEYINWAHDNDPDGSYVDKYLQAYYDQEASRKRLEDAIEKAENLKI